MHSLTSRFNSIFLYTATVLGVMCLLNMLSGWYLYKPKPDIKFNITGIQYFDWNQRFNWDQVDFKFDLEANLSSLYTWNLKQLYFYLEAEYRNEQENLNSSAILYDTILSVPYDRKMVGQQLYVSEKDRRLDEPLKDIYRKLRGQTIKLFFRVEYMPVAGYFFKTTLYQQNFTLPTEYVPYKRS